MSTLQQDIADAKSAMNKAQQELKEAKAAYTEDFKRKNPTASTADLLKYLKLELKELNDNLLSKEAIYLVEKKGEQQQGIGMGG